MLLWGVLVLQPARGRGTQGQVTLCHGVDVGMLRWYPSPPQILALQPPLSTAPISVPSAQTHPALPSNAAFSASCRRTGMVGNLGNPRWSTGDGLPWRCHRSAAQLRHSPAHCSAGSGASAAQGMAAHPKDPKDNASCPPCNPLCGVERQVLAPQQELSLYSVLHSLLSPWTITATPAGPWVQAGDWQHTAMKILLLPSSPACCHLLWASPPSAESRHRIPESTRGQHPCEDTGYPQLRGCGWSCRHREAEIN